MSLRIISENNPEKDVSLDDFSNREIEAAGKGVRPEVVPMFSPEVEKMIRRQQRENNYKTLMKRDPSLRIVRHETSDAIIEFQQEFETIAADAKKKNPDLALKAESTRKQKIPAVL